MSGTTTKFCAIKHNFVALTICPHVCLTLSDDGTWGIVLNCDEFNNDGGDCDTNTDCDGNHKDCTGSVCANEYFHWLGDGICKLIKTSLTFYNFHCNSNSLEELYAQTAPPTEVKPTSYLIPVSI